MVNFTCGYFRLTLKLLIPLSKWIDDLLIEFIFIFHIFENPHPLPDDELTQTLLEVGEADWNAILEKRKYEDQYLHQGSSGNCTGSKDDIGALLFPLPFFSAPNLLYTRLFCGFQYRYLAHCLWIEEDIDWFWLTLPFWGFKWPYNLCYCCKSLLTYHYFFVVILPKSSKMFWHDSFPLIFQYIGS